MSVAVDGAILRAVTLSIGSTVRGAARLSKIRAAALEVLHDYPRADSAALEGPSLDSNHREYDMGEASGVLRQLLHERYSIEPLIIPPSSLKKYATGNGAADKSDMIQYAVRKLLAPIDDENDDAADASILAHLAYCFTSNCPVSTRHAAEVLKQLRTPPPKRKPRVRLTPSI